MALHATYLGANGWLLEFGEPAGELNERPTSERLPERERLSVLVDPWLTGALTFPPGPWLFRGELSHPLPVPERVDLLLLTQGLPDHCHPPSLELIDKETPVVGSASAAARVRERGFTRITALAPGESHRIGALRITATAGAPVPQLENGYLLEHPEGRLYLEPHGFLPADLPARPLDAVITPVVDLGLPLAGAFVRGRQVLPLLLERFRPRTVLASTAGGDVRTTGILPRLLWQQGSPGEAQVTVNAGSRFIDPVPGERYALPVG